MTEGAVAVKNLVLNNDKLYFALSDANEGGIGSKDILVFDTDNGSIDNVCEDISAYSSFVIYKGEIFTFGKEMSSGGYGLYKIDNDKHVELVEEGQKFWGIYAADGYLYYYDINGITSELMKIQIS